MSETWRDIKGFKLYQASDSGQLRSLNYKRTGRVQILIPHITGGYLQTMLKYHTVKVHKMVALVFFGERTSTQEVNHIDGNKLNNTSLNLEYCSRSENCLHSFATGLQKAKRGELNGMAKLTRLQVNEIRHAALTGGRYWGRNELAKKYNVSPKHLQDIVNNPESWKLN